MLVVLVSYRRGMCDKLTTQSFRGLIAEVSSTTLDGRGLLLAEIWLVKVCGVCL